MNTAQVLGSLGLSEKEVTLYLTLLKTGLTSAATLAKETELPRQTVYSLLEAMISEGFIEQSDKKGVRQFYADPNELLRIVNRRRKELDKQKQVLKEELPKILATNRRGKAFPVVQYYSGKEGLKRLFENILEQHRKGKAKTFRGYGINSFYPGMENFLKFFIEERGKYGVKANLFLANAPDGFGIRDDDSAQGRSFKRLNIEEQEAAIYMVGNAVYLFSYKDNVGVMIENQAIARYLKDVFDEAWDRTP